MKPLCILFLLTGCGFYNTNPTPIPEGSYLVISVDAKHLDYRSTESFINSMARNGGEVGHAWLKLQTPKMTIEGGHSGERGILQPRYCDAIQNNLDYGYSNPTEEQKRSPRYEPNPIKCLWETQYDGYFERGPGRHRATYSICILIDVATAEKIACFIKNYRFSEYSLIGNQCTSFCVQAAAIAGVDLEDRIVLPIAQTVRLRGHCYRLWTDLAYSKITFSSPDVLEQSIKKTANLRATRLKSSK